MPDLVTSADPGKQDARSATSLAPSRLSAEKWLHGALIALVALAPLPLASNRPLPAALLSAFAGLLLIGWSVAIPGTGRLPIKPRKILWPLILYGGVCLWIFIQAMPWAPTGLADPIWRTGSEALHDNIASYISVNPGATLSGLMNLLAYAAIFWLSLQLTRDPAAAMLALRAVIAIGATYALYGIVVYVSGNEWITIYRKWAYRDALTSTFVNRNSFATFSGLCLLCAFGLFISQMRHILSAARPARVKAAMLIEHMFMHSRWMTLALISLAIALLLSASRAGVAATGAGLLFVAASQISWRGPRTGQAIAMLGVTIAIASVAFLVAGGALSLRYAANDALPMENARFEIFEIVLGAITTTPWTGTGFGTFSDVFPAYRSPDLSSHFLWDKAHNSYLENALELGLPAMLALNLSIFLLAIRTARGMVERRRDRLFATLGVAATILVGLHSMVDFSLQIPAVSVLYAYLMGLAVSQSWRTTA